MDAGQINSMSPQQKDELMRTVQAQVALANMQELLSVKTLKTGISVQVSYFKFYCRK